jgi:hypothetical protein
MGEAVLVSAVMVSTGRIRSGTVRQRPVRRVGVRFVEAVKVRHRWTCDGTTWLGEAVQAGRFGATSGGVARDAVRRRLAGQSRFGEFGLARQGRIGSASQSVAVSVGRGQSAFVLARSGTARQPRLGRFWQG